MWRLHRRHKRGSHLERRGARGVWVWSGVWHRRAVAPVLYKFGWRGGVAVRRDFFSFRHSGPKQRTAGQPDGTHADHVARMHVFFCNDPAGSYMLEREPTSRPDPVAVAVQPGPTARHFPGRVRAAAVRHHAQHVLDGAVAATAPVM